MVTTSEHRGDDDQCNVDDTDRRYCACGHTGRQTDRELDKEGSRETM
jgi:hypothetical protein